MGIEDVIGLIFRPPALPRVASLAARVSGLRPLVEKALKLAYFSGVIDGLCVGLAVGLVVGLVLAGALKSR